MIFRKLLNKPVLAVGILMAYIFTYQLVQKGYFSNRTKLLRATSCNAVLVKLNRRIPKEWTTLCDYNNLTVSIPVTIPDTEPLKDPNNRKTFLYRELANHLIHISKNSPNDNLEQTLMVRVILESDDLIINALTEGKYLATFATLKTPELIKKHLKSVVKVIESKKEDIKK